MANTTMQTVVVPPLRRVVRYKRDAVGNDLTAVLRWCSTHHEPVWQFSDGSWRCRQADVVGWDTGDHILTDGPWEA